MLTHPQSTIGYETQINTGFQTISSNNPTALITVEGLLYVPIRGQSSTCSSSNSFIPSNVTVDTSFPPNQNYPLISIFPWNNAECVSYYLTSSRTNAVRGAIVFQPNVERPPPGNDQSWSIQDGGRWRTDNQFPIYAVPASWALNQLALSSQYSGSMSAAPNGNQLTQQYDARDYPRLFARVDLVGGPNVPSLWIFLIIVLAVLLGIVITTSIIMHILQRHQRNNLQRRLARGEIDLESLGIKKMNIPQEQIDKMPKYTYNPADVEEPAPFNADGTPTVPATTTPISAAATFAAGKKHANEPQTAFSQPTCPICLDDFIPHNTLIRELPCKHIFHPECIDLFLRDSSSLCPVCKHSALPPGYCPVKVTNLMVRRERLTRRMAERRQVSMNQALRARGEPEIPIPRSPVGNVMFRIKRILRIGEGVPATPAPWVLDADRARYNNDRRSQRLAHDRHDVELGNVPAPAPAPAPEPVSASAAVPLAASATVTAPIHPPPASTPGTRPDSTVVPSEIAAQGASARRAWRRERLARQQEQQFERSEAQLSTQDGSRGRFRRAIGRVFPS